MKAPMGLTEQLLFATARLETDRAVGTGFTFRFTVGADKGIPALITCKHVVEGSSTGRFKLHVAEAEDPRTPSRASQYIELQNFASFWVPHPDPTVDLCAMPIAPLISAAQAQAVNPFLVQLDESLLPSTQELEELQAVETVLMVGYPSGLWDEVNNFPLFRRGITASHPAVDYGGESRFVVDMACIPGSSGSPVLLADQGAYATKNGVTIGTRAKLLGVLSEGPVLPVRGKIVTSKDATPEGQDTVTEVMIHLGFAIKARELKPLGDALKTIASGAPP